MTLNTGPGRTTLRFDQRHQLCPHHLDPRQQRIRASHTRNRIETQPMGIVGNHNVLRRVRCRALHGTCEEFTQRESLNTFGMQRPTACLCWRDYSEHRAALLMRLRHLHKGLSGPRPTPNEVQPVRSGDSMDITAPRCSSVRSGRVTGTFTRAVPAA